MKLLCTLLCLLWSFAVSGQTLHAIVFADTKAERIGEGCQANYDHIRQLLQEIAQNADLTLQPYYFSGEDCTTQNLEQTLENLTVTAEDAVIFYYSGHGEAASKSVWPNLLFSQNEGGILFNLQNIAEQIASKRPKMQLVIGECCNQASDALAFAPGIGRGELKPKQRYKELFGTEANVIVCASAKGLPAYINNEKGGVFYHVFTQALNEELAKNETAGWQNLLFRVEVEMSGLDIKVNGKIQTPSPTPYYEGYHIINQKKQALKVVGRR